MGEGDEELGRILMKGFIFALTQQEHLPSTILFYNGGARLTCEDSASLEDLKNLASLGVEILTSRYLSQPLRPDRQAGSR